MHLHSGNIAPKELGGPILVSIAGQGPIVGCIAPDFETGSSYLCSEKCTPGSEARGNCVHPSNAQLPPEGFLEGLVAQLGPEALASASIGTPGDGQCPICNQVLAGAYHCKGGCQGDLRIKGNTTQSVIPEPVQKIIERLYYHAAGHNATMLDVLQMPDFETVVPSRFCDMDNGNPSNAVQGSWIAGRHSMEYSGNPLDGPRYSPYSIAIEENFDLWCGEELPFLQDLVFSKASYVALHGDFNATGLASLLYGDTFAQLSTDDGIQNCTIYGNASYPCDEGVPGELSPIDAALHHSGFNGTHNETNTDVDEEAIDGSADEWNNEETTEITRKGSMDDESEEASVPSGTKGKEVHLLTAMSLLLPIVVMV